MRVGVQLRPLHPGRIGGLETYVRCLLPALLEVDPELELLLVGHPSNLAGFEAGERLHVLPLDWHELQAMGTTELVMRGVEVWFCPLMALDPGHPGLPSVVTLPDVQHERLPHFFRPSVLADRRRDFHWAARVADRLITLSDFSRREILATLPVSADVVRAIPLAPPSGWAAVDDPQRLGAVRRRHGLPDRFVLYPAASWPHKGHSVLFASLAELRRRGADAGLEVVLTGARLEGASWDEELRRLGLAERVHHLGSVPREELAALFALTSALVLPSRYEGFGLPVVEALAVGCPVVCSDLDSLREVAGDAALYFAVGDPRALADQLVELLGDPALAASLAVRGRSRAADFSWHRTARETVAVLREVRSRPAAAGPVTVVEATKVSVVMPSLNQRSFIGPALDSILDQGYPDIEILIMDGGSDDGTAQVVEEASRRRPGVVTFVSEQDRGQAHAINKGLERATGDVIGWLNADDLYQPGALGRVVAALAEDTAAEVIYGRAWYVDGEGRRIGAYPVQPRFGLADLASECVLCQPAAFLRRSIVDRGVRLDEAIHTCMDYDLWIRLAATGVRFRFVGTFLASSRLHDAAKTMARRELVYREAFATLKRHYGHLPSSWALARAHWRCDGGDPLTITPVSRRALALTVFYLGAHNLHNPRQLARLARAGLAQLRAKVRSGRAESRS